MLSWIRNIALRAAIYYEKSRGVITQKAADAMLAEIKDKQ